MRVLVTGGAGYIGSLTVEQLLEAGHDVVVLDNFLFGKQGLDFARGKIELREGDVRNSADVAYALKGCEAVIHLAGIVGDPACRKNHIADYTTNVESTRTVINCMTDPELELVPTFIFASSCSVYGNVKGLFDEVVEGTQTNPLSLYAHGKLRSEEIIAAKAREEPRFSPTILRLTTLFGWSHRPRIDLVTNLFAYKALKEGELTLFGDGSQYRSLVHAHDVASALVAVLDAPHFARDRKTFHCGDERNNKSLKEIAELVKEQLPDTKIIFKEGAETDRRDYKINCNLIRNVLDWERSYSVEDGITDMIENLRKSGLEFDPLVHGNAAYDYV